MRKFVTVAAAVSALLVAAISAALAQEAPQEEVEQAKPVGGTTSGYITSIEADPLLSGTRIFVEADPSVGFSGYDPATGLHTCEEKIYLTVTAETSISRLQGGVLVPASVEDLSVGQLVSATDTGVLAASCPPQGGAASVTILEELPGFGGGDTGLEQYDPAF